jgi:23S rRNA pseudouridine1911/1915/1917 synthase
MDSVEILYEDNHLLFANKRAGLLTQKAPQETHSLEEELKAYLKYKYQKEGTVFLHAVHRLDRHASGIVLFAKTSKSLSRLNEQIRQLQVKKEYYACVSGKMAGKTRTHLTHYLVHKEHKAIVSSQGNKDAKKAELFYTPIREQKNLQLLLIELTTGRYHQIRAQLACEGSPILGDSKYGSTVFFEENAIALHHTAMTLIHPVTKELLCIRSPLPLSWPLRV